MVDTNRHLLHSMSGLVHVRPMLEDQSYLTPEGRVDRPCAQPYVLGQAQCCSSHLGRVSMLHFLSYDYITE